MDEGGRKQYRLSCWLKLVDLALLALVFIAFFIFTWYGRHGEGQGSTDIRAYGYFIYVSEAVFVLILLIFWRVAGEIGRGNSFSLENVACFRAMGWCGAALSAAYLVRLVWLLLSGQVTAFRTAYCLAMAVVSLLFLAICFILSSLIKNAYEMKEENDLTI